MQEEQEEEVVIDHYISLSVGKLQLRNHMWPVKIFNQALLT